MQDPAQEPEKFAVLRRSRRVWALSPVHGDMPRLRALHAHIEPLFDSGDRIVYLGGYLGRGPEVAGTIDELIAFRRNILARPRIFAYDIVYLRGQQEEMWQKLLQLQFAPNPKE